MKMRLLVIFVIISLSSPIITADSKFDEFLREALLMFRSKMKTGIPDLGIPILDPLDVPDISFHLKKSILDAEFNVTDLVVQDLSNFDVKLVHLDIDKMNLSMHLVFPLLDFKGKIFCDGNITSPLTIPIHGRGNATFNVSDFQFGVSTTIVRKGDHIQLSSLDLGLEFDALKVHIDNIFGSQFIARVVDDILNEFGKSLFDLERKTITKALDKMLLDRINAILKNISINSLMPGAAAYESQISGDFDYQYQNNPQEGRQMEMEIDSTKHQPENRAEEKNSFETKTSHHSSFARDRRTPKSFDFS